MHTIYMYTCITLLLYIQYTYMYIVHCSYTHMNSNLVKIAYQSLHVSLPSINS